MATIGIMVSGRAVPTAASTLPTAPWCRPSCAPKNLYRVGEEGGRNEDCGQGESELYQRQQRPDLPLFFVVNGAVSVAVMYAPRPAGPPRLRRRLRLRAPRR